MKTVLPALFLSLGLAVPPAQKVRLHPVNVVKQEADVSLQTNLCQIIGKSEATAKQLEDYFKENGGIYPVKKLKKGGAADLKSFCQIYIEEAEMESIRAEVAFAQAMKETGWLTFKGDVKAKQYNFAGLGATGNGESGEQFEDVRTGIRAQIQHLKAYAAKNALKHPCVDERYLFVHRGAAPYVEWLGQKENPRGLGWATEENYGIEIAEMVKEILE